ncbi:valine--tRNA ligase-like protein [Dinothrombium tinctorium]|uniref:valine--tRNA ligase n=1 Tax=Dinothrombium tinctorium TaxID=1965070 RepID=A0A443RAE6_9ACAR|nr:valine--tRNA ligase-like protein [Dinothrombium tinctorium]
MPTLSLHSNRYIASPLPKHPNRDLYEPFWYRFWCEQRLFEPRMSSESDNAANDDRFSMILPPPNITGDLHLGHALTVCIQDALFRYQKMMNKSANCVWVPGYDHAGIATQLMIDKLCIAQFGKRSYELPKEKFLEIAEQWKTERFDAIRKQLMRLGAALDFSREFYTLDARLSAAVEEAFIQLFDRGLIYRLESMVNWSYFIKSTVSDIEINWLQVNGPTKIKVPGHNDLVEFGVLHKFAYPIIDSKKSEEIVIATTRVETMLSDVAVAVHPNDTRYSHLVGKELFHPLTKAKLKIIADERADPNFCTGAVKITPSESQTDFDIAKDHNLSGKPYCDENACIVCDEIKSEFRAELNGLDRFSAKLKIIELFDKLGLYRGSEHHKTKVPVCSRSGDIIEKRLLPQWFLNCKTVCEEIKQHLNNDELLIIPQPQKVRLLKWIEKEQDWCISRQISWGHKIPVYKVISDQNIIGFVAAKCETEAIDKAVASYKISKEFMILEKEKDVLDTWFSSALLPFTVFGWPRTNTYEFKSFYPLSVMETGIDILNFWVLRMVILAKYLTGRLPFKKVLLHGLICDVNGRKMTKSIGNVIDPNDVINGVTLDALRERTFSYKTKGILSDFQLTLALENQQKLFPNGIADCGADALRMSLYEVKDKTNDYLRLGVYSIIANRNYVNKMWHAFIFFQLMNEMKLANHKWIHNESDLYCSRAKLSTMDTWIISRLSFFLESCHKNLEENNFEAIHAAINSFWIKDFCDYYLESVKPTFYAQQKDDESISRCLNVLAMCLKVAFVTIHPFMPFVTEELYQRLNFATKPDREHFESILMENYPKMEVWSKWRDQNIESNMDLVKNIIRNLRDVRKNYLAKIEDEVNLLVFVVASSDIINRLTPFANIFPKFTRSNISFVDSERISEDFSKWVNIVVNNDAKLVIKPRSELVLRKCNSVIEKINLLKEKLSTLESKSSKSTVKKKQILKTIQTMEMELKNLEKLKYLTDQNDLKNEDDLSANQM